MFGLTPYSRRDSDLSFFNPFKELEDMERSFFSIGALPNFRTDIRDNGKAYVLETDLPGFDRENISIDVKDGCLTVSASRTEKKEDKNDEKKCLPKSQQILTNIKLFYIFQNTFLASTFSTSLTLTSSFSI